MATSDVEIVNSALIKIGEDPIASLDESRKAARRAKRQFPILRNQLLRMYRWNFAIKRATLAPESTGPAFGFESRFMLPDDCLRVLGIYNDNEPLQNYTSSRVPWKVEQGFIHADGDTLNIFYIAEITDPQQFDAQFDEVLAWFIARDLAFNLSSGPDMVKLADSGYKEALREAKLSDAVEGTPEVVQSSEWLDARLGYDYGYYRAGPIWY